MAKLTLTGNTLEVKSGLRKRKSIDLDDLRLATLLIPTGAKWFVVHSSSTTAYVELDSLDDSTFEEIASEFKGILEAGRRFLLSDFKLFLVGYDNLHTSIKLGDIKASGVDIMAAIRSGRRVRASKRKAWLQGQPSVVLKGRFGRNAVIDPRGYQRGKKVFVPWSEVKTIKVEEINLSRHFFVVPHGVSTSSFSFAKGKYGIGISKDQEELYTVECNFWIGLTQSEKAWTRTDPNACDPLNLAVQKYQAEGYSLVEKRDDQTAVLTRKRNLSGPALLAMVIFWPVGCLYGLYRLLRLFVGPKDTTFLLSLSGSDTHTLKPLPDTQRHE
jgi:hypothetical protein